MAQSYKIPPTLGPDTNYETWKNELEVWKLVTDVKPEKQALAVTLSLTGQARAKALEIDVAQLNTGDGMDILLAALDNLFLQDEVDLAYTAYSDFEKLRKGQDMSMCDFIIEYERRYHICRKYKMEYPDSVLAFKLLDNAGLSMKERQLVLTAASDRKFSSMKSALKRIFGNSSTVNTVNEIKIKEEKEEAFMVKSSKYQQFEKKSRYRQRGTNPLDRNGKRTRCAVCESVFHWAKDCPHKNQKQGEIRMTDAEENEEECHFTKESKSQNEILLMESFGCAIIDTACTKTVCGKRWYEQYVDQLEQKKKKNIKTGASDKSFRFGNGDKVKSYMKATIPAQIGDTHCTIETEVVDIDLPLLLSKDSLRRAEAVLDMSNDKATMFHQPVELNYTSTGHYCIDICCKQEAKDDEESEILLLEGKLNENEKKQTILKLHKQFGHASAENLKKLMQNAGIKNTEVYRDMTEIVEKCDVCARHKKTPPKPVVGMPLAEDYNHTVAVDLHELDRNVWYFHMIDVYTRFSAAVIVRNKRAPTIVENFMKHWIAIHGPPKVVLSDNGSEFNNEEFRDMCQNFNIEVKTTAAYSPWSNGLCERHNQTLTNIMQKVRADKKEINLETALCWALAAKNSMVNTHGFSPYQLVFGKNPNFPSTLTDEPPALEGITRSRTVGQHITSLHATRKAFTEAESSEKIRRALRRQIRPWSGMYQMGERVYYKRPDGHEWKGPGTVVGQDGSIIFVRHGGTLIRVHQSRLQKVKSDLEQENMTRKELQPASETAHDCQQYQSEKSVPKSMLDLDAESDALEEDEGNAPRDTEMNTEDDPVVDTEVETRVDLARIGPGQVIEYNHVDTGTKISAKVLSKAGKATGRNKNWYNIQCLEPEEYEGERMSVDLTKVNGLVLSNTEPATNANSDETVLITNEVSFENAKKEELESWKKNHVYTEIEDSGQKCISTRWICTLKETKDGVKTKAKLVARGFEEIGKEDMQKDSPTCTNESLKVILSVFAQRKWTPCSMDIKIAFLQGKEIDRDIFIRPPNEANSRGKVWHLQKCVYGLNDASLQWYKRVKDVLLKLGGNMSKVDPAVFFWMKENEVTGVFACHVDDFIWGGTKHFEKTVIDEIRKTFKIGKEENKAFQYIGLELSSDGNKVSLQQTKYADILKPISIEKKRTQQKQDDMTAHEK